MTVRAALLLALAVVTLFYLATCWPFARERTADVRWPTWRQLVIGFVTNFFDTLGIGSFAPTTSLFRLWKVIDDGVIPGTLNVGHTLPTIAQAFIYIAIVQVDASTLVTMILAAVSGAWLGAGVVAQWSTVKVRTGMGLALIVAAALMLMSQLGLFPRGGSSLALSGASLAVGAAGNFVLGALMSLGIGLYGPCLVLVSLLGMAPTAAFPIMMGSCAFLLPATTARFLRAEKVDLQAALGLAVGGVPAVLLAAFAVGSLPLNQVRWIVIAVVAYGAASLLRPLGNTKRC